eukprot:m.270675 g.270675  ORF g.270675 m.270675 type:complete len:232 (+) comp48769_c0_seq1:193-888(+)
MITTGAATVCLPHAPITSLGLFGVAFGFMGAGSLSYLSYAYRLRHLLGYGPGMLSFLGFKAGAFFAAWASSIYFVAALYDDDHGGFKIPEISWFDALVTAYRPSKPRPPSVLEIFNDLQIELQSNLQSLALESEIQRQQQWFAWLWQRSPSPQQLSTAAQLTAVRTLLQSIRQLELYHQDEIISWLVRKRQEIVSTSVFPSEEDRVLAEKTLNIINNTLLVTAGTRQPVVE